jgi:transcriptional regulator with XRE-family HTH domain
MGNEQLAARIRAFRKLKGYTQQSFAIKLGVSLAVLGAVERGTRQPDHKLLRRITEGLNIDMEDLMQIT